ncbi:hypothetical protein V8C44DRAFT_346072 [Trichoderma aethiopicum]
MPPSSTGAVYNGSANGTNPSDAINGMTWNDTSHSDAISRFLADQEQRRHLALSGSDRSAADTEGAAKARMLVKLQAFNQQFNTGNQPQAN